MWLWDTQKLKTQVMGLCIGLLITSLNALRLTKESKWDPKKTTVTEWWGPKGPHEWEVCISCHGPTWYVFGLVYMWSRRHVPFKKKILLSVLSVLFHEKIVPKFGIFNTLLAMPMLIVLDSLKHHHGFMMNLWALGDLPLCLFDTLIISWSIFFFFSFSS